MDNAGASVSILRLSCKEFRGYRKMSETTSNGNLEYHQFLTVTEEQEWLSAKIPGYNFLV